jgi:hypothetical protein
VAPDGVDLQSVSTVLAAARDQEPLPAPDPVSFLSKCLERYDSQGIRGYTMVMQKQERLGDVLQPTEEVDVAFREKPHSVFLRWLRGQRRAESVLYVQGENDDKMIARPAGVAGLLVKTVARDPDGEEAKQSGRYSLRDFGLRKGLARSLATWKAAKEKGTLDVRYLGIRKVREAGDRLCYTLRRQMKEPEEDGVTEATLYFDKETWFRVGAVLKGEGGKLIGEYMFRNIRLNPEFKPEQFTPAILSSGPQKTPL